MFCRRRSLRSNVSSFNIPSYNTQNVRPSWSKILHSASVLPSVNRSNWGSEHFRLKTSHTTRFCFGSVFPAPLPYGNSVSRDPHFPVSKNIPFHATPVVVSLLLEDISSRDLSFILGAFFWDFRNEITRKRNKMRSFGWHSNFGMNGIRFPKVEWTASFWKRFIRVFSFWNSPKRMHP